MCEHINGSFPAADGSLEKWQAMLADIRPMVSTSIPALAICRRL